MNRTSPNKSATQPDLRLKRNVVRCKNCGLMQFGTRAGNCRRCFRVLTPKSEFLIPPPEVQERPVSHLNPFETCPNHVVVKEIGLRIRQFRESRKMTQRQLGLRSRLTRSYLSRIESGQMTPSLGTLEKISESFGVGLNRLFVPTTNADTLLEDSFIRGLVTYLRLLEWEQWQSILKRLVAIGSGPLAFASHTAVPFRLKGRCAAPADMSCHNGLSLIG
jgi:transcriptional regulator with XRE-family HTH domain